MVPRVSQRDRDIAFCRQRGLLGHINHLRWHRRLYVIGGYVEDDPYLQLDQDGAPLERPGENEEE